MNNASHIAFFVVAFLLLQSCKDNSRTISADSVGKHESPEAITTAMNSEKKNENDEPYKKSAHRFTSVEEGVDVQVGSIISIYLKIKNDLVRSDSNAASSDASLFAGKTSGFDRSYLSLSQKTIYDEQFSQVASRMQAISVSKNIAQQRSLFAALTKHVYEFAKAFGFTQTLYASRCPMAMNGKGAMWLSSDPEIQNPYYGDAMLTCGKLIEEIY